MDSRKDDAYARKEDAMNVSADIPRPCTIEESIIEACKEVSLMRAGKIPKRSLDDLFSNIEKWSKEESD